MGYFSEAPIQLSHDYPAVVWPLAYVRNYGIGFSCFSLYNRFISLVKRFVIYLRGFSITALYLVPFGLLSTADLAALSKYRQGQKSALQDIRCRDSCLIRPEIYS
jgi:hypothetical protein